MAGNINYFAIDNEVLTADDLYDVLEELSPIDRKADKLGIALGLSAGSYDPTMESVVKTWLDQLYNTERHQLPSYRRLVKAVASKVGGSNPALAKKIASNHPVRSSATSAAVQSDDHVVITTQPPPEAKPLPISASRETDSDGIGDLLQKLLPPQKPKELPLNLRPYPMTKSPHGLCLIINNKNFTGKQSRTGSDVDEASVSKVFPKLGYKLHKEEAHRNCSVKEMISLVQEVADADHSQYDSVVLFLASHGTTGYLYGSDDRLVSIEQIQGILTDSKSLVGKPKIIFIQACRGSELPDGREVQEDGDDDENMFIPRDSDFFFGYATTPSTKACRFTDIGSWYVIELCKMLRDYHAHMDLLRMVTAVHCELATNKEYVYEFKKNGKEVRYKQAPQLVSTLTRAVYFKMDS